MRKATFPIPFLFIAVCLGMGQFGCCSYLGFVVGSGLDNSKPDSIYIESSDADKIKVGRKIKVEQTNLKSVRGKFKGCGSMPQDDYGMQYSKYLQSEQVKYYLPRIGDTINILTRSGSEAREPFWGFDYKLELIKSTKGTNPPFVMRISQATVEKIDEIYIDSINMIFSDMGNSLTGDSLKVLLATHKIPILKTLLLQEKTKDHSVALDDIRKIGWRNKKSAKWILMPIGIALDVGIVILLASLEFSTW